MGRMTKSKRRPGRCECRGEPRAAAAAAQSRKVLLSNPYHPQGEQLLNHSSGAAMGDDFALLKQQALQANAHREARLARERAQKEKELQARQAAADAKDKEQRDKARRLLVLKEQQQQRRKEEEEMLAKKREEAMKAKKEKEKQVAAIAKATGAPTVTKKMISQREAAGLAGRRKKSSGSGSSSSSKSAADYLPLTRAEKRERREREVLGLDIRRPKATSSNGANGNAVAGPSSLRGPQSSIGGTSASSTPDRFIRAKLPSKASAIAPSTGVLRSLEKELKTTISDRKALDARPPSKENLLKARDLEAAERDLRRRIAMERKKEEDRQLARIRAGLPPEPELPDEEEDNVGGGAQKKRKLAEGSSSSPSKTTPGRPESARERFVREEAGRKAQKQAKAATAASPASKKGKRSMQFAETASTDESSNGEYSDEDEDDDSDADSFIDDDPSPLGTGPLREDIWSIMNPGKDKKKYLSRAVIDDSDDDDMEVGMDSVLQEEMRSSRQAREDDKREETLLKKQAEEKARRKKERSGGR